jgi:hypothetical protein
MNKKIPLVKNILNFLEARGWKLIGKNKLYFIFNPPSDIEWDADFQYYVPLHENFEDYQKTANLIVEGLSELYELDFETLYQFLSQTKEEFKKDIEIRKSVLAKAS